MKRKPDYILLGTIIAMVLLGLSALLSASVVESQKDFGNIYSYFLHQLLYGDGIGAVVGLIAYKIYYKKWRMFALPILLTAIFLLLMVLIPAISSEVGGARRWISIAGFSLQPSEFAKLALIVYLAAWFDLRRKTTITRWGEGFIPFVSIVGVVGGLILLQPDVSTLGLIALISAFMFFMAGGSIIQIGFMAALGSGLLWILVSLEQYRLDRLLIFFNKTIDPLGIGYQLNQSLVAIGSGGIFGLGLGQSMQKYRFLPEAMKDSIFAVWAEEVGFLGAMLIISLFIIFTLRGLRIAKNVNSRFGKFLASGITFWVIIQAFINIGSMIGMIPLTGMPLPFISYGGSSMVATLAGMGILLNISKYA